MTDEERELALSARVLAQVKDRDRLRDLINAIPFVPFSFTESTGGEIVHVMNRDAIVEWNQLGDIGMRAGASIKRYWSCRPYVEPPTPVNDPE